MTINLGVPESPLTNGDTMVQQDCQAQKNTKLITFKNRQQSFIIVSALKSIENVCKENH